MTLISCSEKSNESLDLIFQIPDNPISVVTIDDYNKINYDEKNFLFDFFNTDLFDETIFETSKKLIYSNHKIGKGDIAKIIFLEKTENPYNIKITDSTEYDSKIIYEFDYKDIKYFFTENGNFNVISDNKFLIENFTRNSNYSSNPKSKNFYELVNLKTENISVLISESLELESLKNLKIDVSEISDWINFEFEIDNEEILIMGLSIIDSTKKRYVSLLNNVKPKKTEILDIIPDNFNLFKSYSFNKKLFSNNIDEVLFENSTNKIELDSIYQKANEIGYYFSDKDSICIIKLKDIDYEIDFRNFDLVKEYRNEKIFKSEKFKTGINKLNEFEFINDKVFSSFIENNLILANNIQSIERIILNTKNKSTFILNKDFTNFNKKIPSRNSALELVKSKLINENYEIWIKSSQIKDSIIYNSIFTSPIKIKENNQTKLVLSQSFDTEILNNPKIIYNHKTGEKNIIFQNIKNELNLLDFQGKILWKKQLNNKINSTIFQVDTYKNNRLQFLFSTEKELILMDINGNIVKNIKSNSKSFFENLSVFDYDNNKNYRYVFQNGNNLKMYNSSFEIVKGFKRTRLNNGLKEPLKHLRIMNKDYLILKENNDRILILDRRGNIRIKVPKDLFIKSSLFEYKNGLIGFDNKDNIVRIDLSGKISKQELLNSEEKLFAYENNKVTFGSNKLIINGKEFSLPYGSYQNLKINNVNSSYYSIFDKDSQKIYLFDDKEIIDGFPFYSTSDLHMNNHKNKTHLIFLGDKNEIQLFSLN